MDPLKLSLHQINEELLECINQDDNIKLLYHDYFILIDKIKY